MGYYKNSYFILLLLVCSSTFYGMETSKPWWQRAYGLIVVDRDKELLKKYKAPKELEDALNNALENDRRFRKEMDTAPRDQKDYFVCKCPNDLPCYIKGTNNIDGKDRRSNISRLEGKERLEKAIAEVGTDDVIVPTKFLWHIKNREQALNDFNYFIVAEELKAAEKNEELRSLTGIDDLMLENLCKVMQKSRYSDAFQRNVFFTFDNSGKQFWKKDYKANCTQRKKRVAVVDTEISGFNNLFLYAIAKLNSNVNGTVKDFPFADIQMTENNTHPIIYPYYLAIENQMMARHQPKAKKGINDRVLKFLRDYGC